MNLAQLVDRLSEETGTSKAHSEMMIKNLTSLIKTELKQGKSVKIIGFGTFQKKVRKQRSGRNPQTGEKLVIPSREFVKFVPGRALVMAARS